MIPSVVGPEWALFGLFLVLAGVILLAVGDGLMETPHRLAEFSVLGLMVGGGGVVGTGLGIVAMNVLDAAVRAWWLAC